MLAEVAAEHSLPQDAPLLQLLLGRPGLHEGAQEGDQLSVLLRHCGAEEERRCLLLRLCNPTQPRSIVDQSFILTQTPVSFMHV